MGLSAWRGSCARERVAIELPSIASALRPARLPEGVLPMPERTTLVPITRTEIAAPPDHPYAQVVLGGRVVATLSNNGYATTANADANRFRAIFEDDRGLTGPALAQSRADRIAALVGGNVVKSNTALTQSQWEAQRTSFAQGASTSYRAPTLAPGLSVLLGLMRG